jgi:hypothetical protein
LQEKFFAKGGDQADTLWTAPSSFASDQKVSGVILRQPEPPALLRNLAQMFQAPQDGEGSLVAVHMPFAS